jgi:formylglycine-generating enzyme required for sulfatase activity
MMGSTDAQIESSIAQAVKEGWTAGEARQWISAEKPQHQVCFTEGYWIDRTEVTQAQFRQFGGQAAQPPYFRGDNRPVEQIAWFEARDFCAQRGALLPTEAEWEYAARGPDSWIYPWGNTFAVGDVVYYGNSGDQTANVGTKPGGASWVGALDMSGNVWEWTTSLYRPYPYNASDGRENSVDVSSARVLRGGSWYYNGGLIAADLRTAYRYALAPSSRYHVLGFRCARPVTAALSQPPTAAPVVAAVGANSLWTPRFQTFDGVEMALVPPGCFMMGSGGGNNEKPITKTCFDGPFWIDKTEVTQAQFQQFDGQAAQTSYFKGDNRPVEQISWIEARDFCAQRSTRLPTEAEWEYAARGPNSAIYPWGDTFEMDNVVYGETSGGHTADVGSRPGGASWVGALDMSGNVWEWVSTIYRPYPYRPNDGRESSTDTSNARGRRGGSWYNVGINLNAANRNYSDPFFWYDDIGFRCARSFD